MLNEQITKRRRMQAYCLLLETLIKTGNGMATIYEEDEIYALLDYVDRDSGIPVYRKYVVRDSFVDDSLSVWWTDNRYGCLPLRPLLTPPQGQE